MAQYNFLNKATPKFIRIANYNKRLNALLGLFNVQRVTNFGKHVPKGSYSKARKAYRKSLAKRAHHRPAGTKLAREANAKRLGVPLRN